LGVLNVFVDMVNETSLSKVVKGRYVLLDLNLSVN
jgi:hypothetical protein